MDFSWLFKYVFPIATVIAGAASAIAHGVFGVSHPLVIDQIAVGLGSVTAAKASLKAHTTPDDPQAGGGA